MIREQIKRIITRASDIVFHGRNKAMILIGTDRKDTLDSGYGDGGDNDKDSAIIDIVAGFSKDSTQPNYKSDKSRIYVAEKTDPDSYFEIQKGTNIEGEPAIVGISDNVYLKARKKIKIVNGNISILINDDGTLNIEAEEQIKIKCGNANLLLNKNGLVQIGKQSSQEDFVALANKVLQEFESVRNLLRTHIHPVNSTTAIAGPTNTPVPSTNSVAASNVKAD